MKKKRLRKVFAGPFGAFCRGLGRPHKEEGLLVIDTRLECEVIRATDRERGGGGAGNDRVGAAGRADGKRVQVGHVARGSGSDGGGSDKGRKVSGAALDTSGTDRVGDGLHVGATGLLLKSATALR